MIVYTDYLGIDISKKTFDVSDKEGKHYQFDNSKSGFKKFKKLTSSTSLCIMEYSGVYYLQLASYLYDNGVPVSVFNPLQIKRFTQMHLQRNKTDKADSKMLSLYGQKESNKLWKKPSEEHEESKDLSVLIDQYIGIRSGLKCKLDALRSKVSEQYLIQSVVDQIDQLGETILDLQAKLEHITESLHPEMLSNISSIAGIGKQTASTLIMHSNAFEGFENAKQLSSYYGLAPTEFSSGTSVNKRMKISKMGNPLIRKKLYMCSLQASRCNPACRNLYLRLIAKGKPKKLALIAVANKLLKQVFAIAKSNIPYDKEYVSYKNPIRKR